MQAEEKLPLPSFLWSGYTLFRDRTSSILSPIASLVPQADPTTTLSPEVPLDESPATRQSDTVQTEGQSEVVGAVPVREDGSGQPAPMAAHEMEMRNAALARAAEEVSSTECEERSEGSARNSHMNRLADQGPGLGAVTQTLQTPTLHLTP